MILRVDNALGIEVLFSLSNREIGYDDDIRFALRQSGPKERRLFPADEISFLLTADVSALRPA